ncbi:MAG TPA: hypothetical protein VN040_27080 [Pseudosphingobacterium sp.]|nr:hypothetical protein [Pseudosphingobacterium sp.]
MDNQADVDNSSINLYEAYSSRKSFNNSLMASLRSEITPRITNELKLQYFLVSEEMIAHPQLLAASIPRAIVENFLVVWNLNMFLFM